MHGRLVAFTFAALAAAPLAQAVTYTGVVLYQPMDGSPARGAGVYEPAAEGQLVGDTTLPDAALWKAPSGTMSTLPPPSGFSTSLAKATDGVDQVVGYGYGNATGNNNHALLWNGTAASAIDLNGNLVQSTAYGVGGGQQVGVGSTNGSDEHAVLWSGSATTMIDLNPAGFGSSVAYATDGSQQVGSGAGNALLWSGTAASAVNLNPTGFISSEAYGVGGGQEVGYGLNTAANKFQALVWTGSANSAVDLQPTDLGPFNTLTESFAYGTNGTEQVGYGDDQGLNPEALLWYGTAGSAVDLQALLPSNMGWTESYAYSIDSSGNIFGLAVSGGSAFYAVEWSPVPEPTSAVLMAVGCVGLLVRRRRVNERV